MVSERNASQTGAEDDYRVCRGWQRGTRVDKSLGLFAGREEPEQNWSERGETGQRWREPGGWEERRGQKNQVYYGLWLWLTGTRGTQ